MGWKRKQENITTKKIEKKVDYRRRFLYKIQQLFRVLFAKLFL